MAYEFKLEENIIEKERNNSIALLRDAMRIMKSKMGKALLETEEELKGDITKVYRLDREALKKERERARRI